MSRKKPLHSFVHKNLYLYQEHKLLHYVVKVIEFQFLMNLNILKIKNYFYFGYGNVIRYTSSVM